MKDILLISHAADQVIDLLKSLRPLIRIYHLKTIIEFKTEIAFCVGV